MTTAPVSPAWLDHAWADLGISEIAGPRGSPRVLACFRDSGHPGITSDETAWCAAFVGACLNRAGIRPSGSLMARSYLAWGQRCSPPRPGAIAVFSRGSDPSLGHVAFFLAAAGDEIVVLGGNQSDAVTVTRYPRSRLLDLRWPAVSSEAGAGDPGASGDASFARAIAHVLEMEGGWSDDPHDPGGPTNLGITLATFAAWSRRSVTAETFADLRAELRRLVPADVRPIYRERYWVPSRAAELPAPLAFFHFDTAVNHGVGGAARMLQEALGVSVDGEIGPLTLSAASAARMSRLLETYAEVRRARYRALPHFWRFGRGWLVRVDRTLSAARAQPGAKTVPSSSNTETTMTDITESPQTSQPSSASNKWWGNSLTVWGTFVTALSTVLPVLGPLVGLDLSAELVRQLGQGVAQAIQAIGGVVGTVMAILGRARAAQPLVRRDITVRL
jgi:uncharacterized protein (TIGR02594 family)